MVGTLKGNSKDNSKRRFAGGGPRPDNNELKRQEAEERNTAWAKLSPEQQLKALDSRPGESKRQRERLTTLIERKKHQPKPVPKEAQPVGQLLERGENVKAKERRAAEQAKRPSK